MTTSRSERSDLLRDISGRIESAPDRRVPTLRRIRRKASKRLQHLTGREVLDLAREMLRSADDVPRWFVYEMVHHHEPAMASLDAGVLADVGQGMHAWGEVDAFACYLSGVAWRECQITDEDVMAWADSDDRWWRRVAVVSTVPLNVKARGGSGDAARTLAICDRLRADRDDMVVKAVSWALRALAQREPAAVRRYLDAAGDALAPKVRREVRNKLETGRKSGARG